MADIKGICSGFGMGLEMTGSPTLNNHTVDANNDGVGFSFQARSADAITHIGFRYGARTGTPPTFVATLESPDTGTGLPNGTDVGGGSATAKTFTPPADATWDGTWQWIQLTNSYTPTRGQWLCGTIRYSSGTIDGSNLSTFTTDISGVSPGASQGYPLGLRLTAGTWAKRTGGNCFGLRTASNRYGFPIKNFYNTRSASTVGHRQALKFTLPAGSSDTFKIRGVRFTGSPSGASGKTPIIGLWSASSTIQNVTIDTEYVNNPTIAYVTHRFQFDEASLTALNFGTAYYLGLEVADAVSGGVLINGLQLDASSDLDAFPGGSEWHLATYDGATWTDDATVRPMVELIFDDITEPAASGGGSGLVANLSGGVFQ